jgi:NAD+ kinase
MKIAVYAHPLEDITIEFVKKLFNKLKENKIKVLLYSEFYQFLKTNHNFDVDFAELFTYHTEIKKDVDFFISIGGDGTFLETVYFVRDKQIPIVGINSGRLGFLATISKDEIDKAVNDLITNNFEIEERTLIELDTNKKLFTDFNIALNEFTIQKTYSSSMIKIEVRVNNEYLNTYWSDGLIISTPTGSTAYSLSAGGPIVVPNSKNFIITPISPHNLTARPLVLSDDKEVTIKVYGRSKMFLASLDYRSETFNEGLELKIKKANFTIPIIIFKDVSFYATLRNKLMWGADKRSTL